MSTRIGSAEVPDYSGFQFGNYCLHIADRALTREGRLIALPPKVFDTLMVLVERRGRVVEKEEMMQRIWPDTFVEEANLSVNISTLRKSLGEEVGEARFIETIPKRGYRFVAEVKLLYAESTDWLPPRQTQALPFLRDVTALQTPALGSQDEREATSTPLSWSDRLKRQKSLPLLLALALILSFSAIAYKAQLQSSRTRRPIAIAVLPFQNLRPDGETDFLKLSLPNSLISRLSQADGVKVRPTASIVKYLDKELDLKIIAEELHADYLLLCTYSREADDIKLSPQLIKAREDEVLWAEEIRIPYNRLASVETILRDRISAALKVTPPTDKRPGRDPQDLQAFEFYLRGIDRLLAEDFTIAIEMLNQAVALDPGYAPAWMQLGRAYTAHASTQFGGKSEYEKATMAYDRVLQLDPDNLEVAVFQANLFTDTNRVELAVPLLRKAIAADSEQARAHWVLSYAYRYGGLLKESLDEGEQARRLDAGLKLTRATFNAYLYTGQYEKFLATLPREPTQAFTFFYRGFAYYHLKEWERAIQDFDHAYRLDSTLLQTQIGKALSYALEGRTQSARALLEETERTVEQQGLMDGEGIYKLAQAYEAINEHQAALRVLRRSIERGFFCYAYFVRDPLMDHLHSDAQYQALMAQAKSRSEIFQQQFAANPEP
ncbi:MAG: winged helix-turn-helix domain-containing protein [Acidobacteria bacterium]|nr:winged helix-turn-helix domain-containing protein [Acidobacteriota bacterium]